MRSKWEVLLPKFDAELISGIYTALKEFIQSAFFGSNSIDQENFPQFKEHGKFLQSLFHLSCDYDLM